MGMKKKCLNIRIRDFELKNFPVTILTCLFIMSSILVCTANCFAEEEYLSVVVKYSQK